MTHPARDASPLTIPFRIGHVVATTIRYVNFDIVVAAS
ncbi:hypothetical protein Sthe_1774 [Sphaerobacter thermophilus DSM 20745]|jgi:hypothetical protein|uniref:Uncharacterized protein n=1 Tax=Sphaerobacter thermophilus (strain ATCC 49802 / DSM 20745 / KCCM 41009 / NCIMB 13125 / S 6022) TaxID=479434 RepID=D1C4P1_SPHTD|nr:hypothetical protein Sthe_1774 [Sphaerobacter thermophilus DSM 20745]